MLGANTLSSEINSSKNYKFQFATVLLISLLSTAGIALPYPILSPMFLDAPLTGFTHYMEIAPEILFGIAMAVYPLGMLLGSSILGSLSDHYGRKRVLIISLILAAVGYMLTAYAIVQQNYPLFIFSRFVTGLTEGNIAIARAMALDFSDRIDKTKAMSMLNAANFTGWLLGPLIGGVFAYLGNEQIFIFAAISVVFSSVLVFFVLKESQSANALANTKTKFNFRHLLNTNSFNLIKTPLIKQLFYVQLCYTLGLNAFYEFYPAWLVQVQDYTAFDIGMVTTALTGFMIFTSVFVVSRLKTWVGEEILMKASLLILSAVICIMPLMKGDPIPLVFVLCGGCIALYNGLFPVYLSDVHNNEKENGALMGLMTSAFCMANVIIAIVGSFLLLIDPKLPLFVGSGLIFCSMLLLHFVMESNKKTSNTQESF